MIFSHANTLKFASDATEPQFHLTSMSLYLYLRKEGKSIIDFIIFNYKKLSKIVPKIEANNSHLDRENLINYQISKLPPETKVHGQLGMTDCHACYYKHNEEISLKEIINTQNYSAQKLTENKRNNKAKKLEKTFARSTDLLGKQTYLDFLAMWEPIYSNPDTDPQQLINSIHKQAEDMSDVILPLSMTQIIFNYHLS